MSDEKNDEQKPTPKRPDMRAIGSGPASTPTPSGDLPHLGKTVTMTFKKRCLLNLGPGKMVEFLPGPQEVPEELANHWYLKAHGAVAYQRHTVEPLPEGTAAPQFAEDPAKRQEAVDYVVARGYTPEAAEKLVTEHGVSAILASKALGPEVSEEEMEEELAEDAKAQAEGGTHQEPDRNPNQAFDSGNKPEEEEKAQPARGRGRKR
jgi:hypothetical protein